MNDLLNRMEPDVAPHLGGDPNTWALVSIAISLRRIADALRGTDDEYGLQQLLGDFWADREARP